MGKCCAATTDQKNSNKKTPLESKEFTKNGDGQKQMPPKNGISRPIKHTNNKQANLEEPSSALYELQTAASKEQQNGLQFPSQSQEGHTPTLQN